MTTEGAAAATGAAGPPVPPPRRLLVPVDLGEASDRVLDTAAAVAGRLGCPLTLFSWHWDPDRIRVAEEGLAERARELGGDVTVEVALTDAPGAAGPLLRAARRQWDTVVCMATRARSPVGAAVLGSVAEDVVRRAVEPVVLVGPAVPPGAPDLARPVVVCVDGSEVSERAVPVAAGWAAAMGVPLEVVTVLPPGRTPVVEGEPVDVVDSAYVQGVAAAAGEGTSWEVLRGSDPAEVVVDHARRRASVLALATHGRTGLARVVAGSVALRVVQRASCPVLLVRPPDLG